MMKKLLLVIVALGLSFPSFAREVAPVKVKAGIPEVSTALEEWIEAVEGSSPEAVVALYDKKAVMISSFNQQPITKQGELYGYYKKVLSNPDARVEVQEENVRRFGDIAINSGRYTLSYTQEGEPVVVPARFTFVYQLQGGKWMIVDHHSSPVPLPIEPKK